MRAPVAGPVGVSGRGLRRGLVLLLTVVLAAALLVLLGPARTTSSSAGRGTPAPAPLADATRGDAGDGPEAAPRLTLARRDTAERDKPVLPAKCFGPGHSNIEPFPCPLNQHRKGQPVVVLWGDSHAYQWIPAMIEAVKGQRVNLVSMVAPSCPPILVTRDPGRRSCKRSNYVAYRYVRQLLREKATFTVVLGSNWSGFRRGYRAMMLEAVGGPPTGYVDYTRQMVSMANEGTPALFSRLGSLGVDVDVIAQAATVPARRPGCELGDDPYACDLPRWRAIPEEQATKTYLARQQAKIRKRGSSSTIDPSRGYCDTAVCHGRVGSVETYYDDLHISATRSRTLARYFVPAVREAARR